MTIAATQFPLIGVQPASNSSLLGIEVSTATTGYVPLIPIGTIITVNDPYAIQPATTSLALGSA